MSTPEDPDWTPPGWPDSTVVIADGRAWFACSYRHGIRRVVPPDYEDGKTILLLREFCEKYPAALPVWRSCPDG